MNATKNYYDINNFLVWNGMQVVALLYTLVSNSIIFSLRSIPFINQLLPLPNINELPLSTISKRKKIAIVTGSNTGIGFETSRILVQRYGYDVILACRSRDKAMDAIQRINASSHKGGKATFLVPLDLTDPSSILKFANVVRDKYNSLDVLINNAGRNHGGSCKAGNKKQMDEIFCANYLGHFLLTKQLLPLLKMCSMDQDKNNARIINLSSVMHHFCYHISGRHDKAYWEQQAYHTPDGLSSYSSSKLAALYFTLELNRLFFSSDGIKSIAVNPGAVNSDIWRTTPKYIIPIFKLLYLTNVQGSYTSVAATVCEKYFEKDTFYLQPYHQFFSKRKACCWPPTEMLGVFAGHIQTQPRLPNDADTENSPGSRSAQILWKASEELLKEWIDNPEEK